MNDLLLLRLRNELDEIPNIEEKNMFGGTVFLLNGNMLVGIHQGNFVARIGKNQYEMALTKPFVLKFNIKGKEMLGWVIIKPEGIVKDEDLQKWIKLAMEFVKTLSSK